MSLKLSFFQRMKIVGLLSVISWMSQVWAYELVVIQTVSQTKKTFVTHTGKNEGISEGQEYTFTTPNLSLLAKAITVTRDYTQWLVVEPKAIAPFEKGQIVSAHPAPEHTQLYANLPQRVLEEEEKLRKENFLKRKEFYDRVISFKGGGARSLSQSVSNVSPQILSRDTSHWELYFQKMFSDGFYFGLGARMDEETTETETAIVVSQKYLFLVDLEYHHLFFNSQNLYLTAGISLGAGPSYTEVGPEELSGKTLLIPSVRGGIEYYISAFSLALSLEGAMETLSTREDFVDGTHQTTDATNLKLALGLKKYF